jgi:hypothetical protein
LMLTLTIVKLMAELLLLVICTTLVKLNNSFKPGMSACLVFI